MSETQTHPFRRRTLLGLLSIAAAAFVAMAYFAIDDDAPRAGNESAGTTSASRSAVGYRAFIELLRQFEPQVLSRMSRSSSRAALRLLLAPADKAEVRYVIAARTGPALIVLPKWHTLRDGLSDRVRTAHLLAPETVRELAREVARDIEIVRPQTLAVRRDSEIRGTPELGHPQLVTSSLLCPLLSAAEGILIGRLCARPDVIVLADPDLLANHGLWRGQNATVAMNLVSRIRGSGPLILALESDAAAAAASRNIWRLAVTPPFLAITIGFAIAAAVALWMAALRFGPPAKDSAGPAVGIFTLIDVGAGLLHARNHGGRVLRRYAELQALDLGRRLHAPRATTSPAEISAWLDASRRRRTPGPGYGELMREVDQLDHAAKADPAAIVATAGRLFRWWKDSCMDVEPLVSLRTRVTEEIGKVVVGQREAIDLMLVALMADGHILLEGVPGVAKTLLARSFAACLSLKFSRVQFTPDLMPGDVIGANIFNFQTNTFVLTHGPIFTQLLLADEINRTPPKTQAALLEAMQERAVTIDGRSHGLGPPFMVIATQNPIEQQGTYPLPEAQLDRFLFKHTLDYPSREDELAVVARHGAGAAMADPRHLGVTPVIDTAGLQSLGALVDAVRLNDDIVAYVVDLVRATRQQPTLQFGASPRAAAMLASSARALAAFEGRDFVIPDDVKRLARPALRHRLVLSPSAEIEGQNVDGVLTQIIERQAAPR